MPNRLAGATSPYLQQHAGNPVDWYPWSEEALAKARAERKPILLSIGYSACHWCHVMAHESFEDPDVAAAMNDAFVNIKVDREERPDLDQIYQTAHALLTRRSGGWPLTMFLTPEGAPFFGGTYFPKHGRYGLPGFVELLPKVASAYREQGDRLAEQNRRLADALQSLEPEGGPAPPPANAAAAALAGLKHSFDAVHGGFGSAPKFPHPFELDFCLRAFAANADEEALAIVRVTLDHMADGGIHDQLGGGFCRYSVDAQWTIPHFEKMLYDNGPLLALYADLSRVTGERRYADVARDIVGWLVREMRADDGAFYSSLDADSEGSEGKFYVWTREEARAAVTDEEWVVAEPYYGLDAPPNFEGHAWNLRVAERLESVAGRLGLSSPDATTRRAGARAALFAAREKRVRPGRDDKILTAWNALAIGGLARAANALDMPRWADLAFAAVDTLGARHGATDGSSLRAGAITRTSMPISTIMPLCWRPSSNSCSCASGEKTSPGRASSRKRCLRDSRIASAEDSSSRATTTSRCSIAPSPATTTLHPRATALPRRRSSPSAILRRSRATSRPRNAR
jgi:uncharacterized protein YyaL (SSP411 family)